jgi:hypothetical protein
MAENYSSIKSQIRDNLEKVSHMKPICHINHIVQKHAPIETYVRHALTISRKWGGQFERKDFGYNIFDESRIRKTFNYQLSDLEIAAFEAVPYIIRSGIQLTGHPNHKGRGYSTITFVGKVIINETVCALGVSVKQTTKNYYSVHRILVL